ncbi:ribosome biogenesis protein Nop53/GLTSCR2 [Flammula alnicola]|nr:ribosome biogenesis protein Nop53/GLTSCR2 [Flammula alnicola]
MATSKSSKASALDSKPTSKAKGKKPARSAVGAPSQHTQASRKGKRAWRKNVNIEDVEEVLEGMRAEERVTGTTLHQMQDGQLFQVDTKGDDKIRHSLPRYSASQLTSTKILAQRSAVPAVFSRTTPGSNKRKPVLNREEKERLMRIAKRPRKGPFNSIMDPSEYAAGSRVVALSEAVKLSGTYDPWAPQPPEEELKDGLETVTKKKAKPPIVTNTRDLIEVPAIVEPHQGTSYNPPADAHQELLVKAATIEQKRLEQAEKLAETKKKIEEAKDNQEEYDFSVAPGMKVQGLHANEEEEEEPQGEDESQQLAKKVPERKTKAQKNKAARLLKEKRALAEKAQRKRLLASINDAKAIRRSTARVMSAQEQEREQRLLKLAEKLKKQGLAGQKLGKHKVPEDSVVVQLGEDLSESLRGLKPEGNLFRDRFQSLQQRALIEPRVPVLPTKRRNRTIEYEKHAWKNFDRE